MAWWDRVKEWWPAIAAVAAVVIGGVQADAQIKDDTQRIQALETGQPQIADRLARMEQHEADISETVKRIEEKVDREH